MDTSIFKVKKDGKKRGWVVIRIDGVYENHAHLKTMNGWRQLRYCLRNNLLPRSEYLQGSCRRLLTDIEYQRLKRPKDNYYNSKQRRIG